VFLLALLAACTSPATGTADAPEARPPAAPAGSAEGAPAESGGASATFDHDHTAWGRILDGAVTEAGRVRYDLLRKRDDALDAYLATLADAPVGAFSRPQRIAFWVNAYNALTVDLIVENPGIGSIKELDEGQVWKRRTFRVGGQELTLDAIEHEKARPLTDGRVHAVINCASIGCPPLPPDPLRAATLDAQLDAAARAWVADGALVEQGSTLALSPIFKWFPGDFETWRQDAIPGANEAQTRALWFAAAHAPPGTDTAAWTSGGRPVTWAEYDWSLNEASR